MYKLFHEVHDMSSLAPQPTPEALDKIRKRFSGVSLDEPLNAMLFDLALEHESRRMDGPDFSEGMGYMNGPLPDSIKLMEMKRKMSLAPMEAFEQKVRLPTLPPLIPKLQKAIDESAHSQEIADIIRPDPKLAASILSLVNSPLYSLSTKVETLSRAVAIIGSKELSNLALLTRTLAMFEDCLPDYIPIRSFWKHSIACATLAHSIAMLRGNQDKERFFIAGLLHDLGRLVLFSNFPEMAGVVLAMQKQENMSLHEAEMTVFDVDHCLVGGLFFAKWNLPQGVINAALCHHEPERCQGKDTAEVVYVANQIATALGLGCNQVYDMPTGEGVWESLGISPTEIRTLLVGLDAVLYEMFHSLIGE